MLGFFCISFPYPDPEAAPEEQGQRLVCSHTPDMQPSAQDTLSDQETFVGCVTEDGRVGREDGGDGRGCTVLGLYPHTLPACPQCPAGNVVVVLTPLLTKRSASEALDLRFERRCHGTEASGRDTLICIPRKTGFQASHQLPSLLLLTTRNN